MKTNRILLIVIFAALAVYVLTSFKAADKKEDFQGGNRIIKEYYDGRTFYVLLDYNDKAVNFIEKK